MTDLGRRPVEPLAPPPGQFDVVLSRATQRRHRRAARLLAVTAVFLAGLGGGMSVDGGVTAVPQALVDLTTDGGTPPPAPIETSTAASDTPEVTTSPEEEPVRSAPSPTEVATTAPSGVLAVHGRALSPGGDPLGGLYVYAGKPGADGFVPTAEPAGVTAEDGTFALRCPGTPVLLSSWPLNAPAGELASTARWASTFVGGATQPGSAADAPCSRQEGKVTETVLQPGSALAATATIAAACDQGRTLGVWLYEDRGLSVRVTGVRDGDTVRVAGLPPGRHTIAASGEHVGVTVGGGETSAQEVTFGCDATEPTPTGSPTESPTPAPLPTISVTPEPSPTSGTATATPTG